jgi:hypothetical protein
MMLPTFRRWMIYQVGLAPVSPRDLELNASDWVSIFNTEWHFQSASLVQAELKAMVEEQWLKVVDGVYSIEEPGQQVWIEQFKPKWLNSFSRATESLESFRSESDFELDVYIISTSTQIMLWKVVVSDLCRRFYGCVELDTIELCENVDFHPLYWKKLTGFSARFVANVVPSFGTTFDLSDRISQYKYHHRVPEQLKWHLDFSLGGRSE